MKVDWVIENKISFDFSCRILNKQNDDEYKYVKWEYKIRGI